MVARDKVPGLPNDLVPTVPDATQYQVMRVMHYLGWKYVRVINLSDLRDARSDSFVQRYIAFERAAGGASHSVFSSDRSQELRRHLSRKSGAPIVCAWGVSSGLNPLISRAVKALDSESGVTGWAKPGQAGKYFHPLPTLQRDKEHWVDRMLAELKISDPTSKAASLDGA